MHLSPIFIMLLFSCIVIYGAENCTHKESVCNKKSSTNCEECIAEDVCCVWVYEEETNLPRCNIPENIQKELVNLVEGVKPEYNMYEANEDYYVPKETNDRASIQMRPQKIRLNLRKGESAVFNITYKAAKNYPLDVYYLMDLTYSMSSHLDTMISLGDRLGKSLQNMTETYKLGLGYFSDKVAMPYSVMTGKHFDNPCMLHGGTCYKPFDFIHALSFTQDVQRFVEKVTKAEKKLTANLDDLEGGFDALLQLMSCKENVGWRTYARKIVVLATDGLLHTAGDGILAGSIKRNNGACYLHESQYDKSELVYDNLMYDYPSLEEIFRKLQQNKIQVLFVINKNRDYYETLHEAMDTVTRVGILEDDSSNIIDLVEKAYRELAETVQFQHAHAPSNIRVSFSSMCNGKKMLSTNVCKDVVLDKEYTFTVNVTLMDYEKNQNSAKFTITEKNIEETIEVEVGYVGACNCNTDTDDSFARSSATTCQNGNMHCGKCLCDEGWTGETCSRECEKRNCGYSGYFDIGSCQCTCDDGFTGFNCEFDLSKCKDKITRLICNEQGTCNQERCQCRSNYIGEFCECAVSNDTCIFPGKAEICSGHGHCECGECICETDNFKYEGKFCERCKECQNLCKTYEKKVRDLDNPHESHESVGVEMNKVDLLQGGDNRVKCMTHWYEEDKNCRIEYTYELTTETVKLEYLEKICSDIQKGTVKVMAIIIVVILVIGLIVILLYKCIQTAKDRKEFSDYRKAIMASRMVTENPIYKNPVTSTQNPMYGDMKM